MARISDERRAAIEADIRAGGMSRAAIARAHEVSPDSVRRIAAEAGIENPFDTAPTRTATAAARDHLRERRARVSARFLGKVDELLDKMDGPFLVYAFGGRDNEYNEHVLTGPPTGDIKNLMTSAAIAFDKHLAADKHDSTGDDEAAGDVLVKLFDGLGAAYKVLRSQPGSGEGDE